ncbi:MAG TPA: carbon storage regulator [Gemmataceae bacterium]|jgi:carbon storage regulator
MLVLTRKEGEQIVLGENIRVTVLAIKGKRVRLGVFAPPDVSIVREELGPLDDSLRTPSPAVRKLMRG